MCGFTSLVMLTLKSHRSAKESLSEIARLTAEAAVGIMQRSQRAPAPHTESLAMFGWVCQAGDMKKQASDQAFHDRRYQERKRAEAAKKAAPKKVAAENP